MKKCFMHMFIAILTKLLSGTVRLLCDDASKYIHPVLRNNGHPKNEKRRTFSILLRRGINCLDKKYQLNCVIATRSNRWSSNAHD